MPPPGRPPLAIVFNCHYNGLSVIHELSAHGIPCIAMDSARSVGTFSRYARYVRCPNPLSDESRFVEFLHDFCAAQATKPVLFPTNDEWAVAVSKEKSRLSEVAIPCVGDWEAVALTVEKDRFYEFAQRRSYPVPSTWDPHEVHRLSGDEFPIVAKPRFRRNASDGDLVAMMRSMGRLRLSVLEDGADLARFMAAERQALPNLVFQEFVPGASDAMYTVGLYVDRNHETRAVFTGRKVRGYPADIGDCMVGEVHGVPEEVVDLSARLAGDLQLSGIMEIEYKLDARTGRFRLIEVNPRPWSWIGITPRCGVSLPLIAYRDLALGRGDDGVKRVAKPDGSVRYYRAVPDFLNSTLRYRRSFPRWQKSPSAWWKELRGTPDLVLAEFRARDYKVGLIAVLAEVWSAVKRPLRRRLRSRPR
jgi:predicted ATP-grasp superfamily ATP-dependent carboligase